jgi:hypothetical protein
LFDGKRGEAMPGLQRDNEAGATAGDDMTKFFPPVARVLESVIFTAGMSEEVAPAMDKPTASGPPDSNVLTAQLFSFNRRVVIERAAALGLPAIDEWLKGADKSDRQGLVSEAAAFPLAPRLDPAK